MDSQMYQSKDDKFIPMTSISSGKVREARSDVSYYTNQIVNVIFIGSAEGWVLVDAGMPKCGEEIRLVAEDIFGANAKPAAIILTHGHFDHVGGIVHLIEHWNVPVYAHPLEFPFLTGQQSYPEPDTSVEGGMLAKISSIYPNEPIDITPALRELPADGSIPHLQDWRWIHTPGHSPGQVALFRESDATLISADAFITVKQDSMYKVLVQKKEVCGPPVYLTTDWRAAYESVQKLAALNPQLVVPGHGTAMDGAELTEGLRRLVNEFETVAVPEHGKFVDKES
ncbi:MBL fold metallo-hydrolase [Segetibacter aerophilus]|uniref:MBL fold metallo-hydrolase n=1 Tax=Segetibacter aerophilus TaxID=670293 RepID=A0A512BGM2_9BACT|nr:MBL fold metallo-hydrolase [Segetibacter aerophilus]GEO11025.1 MBL fold metallo-hydrolase [Segetibacter aerophilus]